MAGKSDKEKERDSVHMALNSLDELFPEIKPHPRYNDKVVSTKETQAILAKIVKRKRELSNDAELKKLNDELDKKRNELAAQANGLNRKLQKLRRRFYLRGVNEKLLQDIEAMENETPLITIEKQHETAEEDE